MDYKKSYRSYISEYHLLINVSSVEILYWPDFRYLPVTGTRTRLRVRPKRNNGSPLTLHQGGGSPRLGEHPIFLVLRTLMILLCTFIY